MRRQREQPPQSPSAPLSAPPANEAWQVLSGPVCSPLSGERLLGLPYSTHTTVEPDVLLPAAQLSSWQGPPRDGRGWMDRWQEQNLWLIASLMWQRPAVWGNWSAGRVDTFCVLLGCRLLLAPALGTRRRGRFTRQTLRGQHQLFIVPIDLGGLPPPNPCSPPNLPCCG